MRKFLTALLVVTLLAISILFVACQKFEGESAFDALKQLEEKGKIKLQYDEGVDIFFTSVKYKDVTLANDNAAGKYIGIFINSDDEALQDPYGMCDSFEYDGEKFNYSGVAINKIPYTEGLKVIIALTEDVGNWHYAAVKDTVLLFTLPNGVKKTALN